MAPTSHAHSRSPTLPLIYASTILRSCRSSTLHAPILPILHRVPNIQQYLEVQLFSPVGEVECGHLGLVACGLGALEGLAVHVVEVAEDAFAGTGHADLLESSECEARRVITGETARAIAGCVEQKALRCSDERTTRIEGVGH